MTRSVWLFGAGVAAIVLGFTKTIAPLIELGAVLVVIPLIAMPVSK